MTRLDLEELMFEIVNEILAGNYIHENGSLDFSHTKIELSLFQNQQEEGSFHIYGEQGAVVMGKVLSTDYRMEVLTPDFSGTDSEISYVFHGESAENGETVKGAFRIISNQGEYALPFVCECRHPIPTSSMGPIKNLFHFTNLAKSDWQEALHLFYSKEFPEILTGADAQYQNIYRGLSAYPENAQNMEEFLIHVGKKQAVEYRADSDLIELNLLPGDGEYQLLEQEIKLIRNGWGYTALNLECDGSFLFSEKTLITEDDFLGNYARIPVYVDKNCLNVGINKGKVVFFNSYVNLEVDVAIRFGMDNMWDQTQISKERCIAAIMNRYEEFRTKKLGLQNWLKETDLLVEKLIAMDDSDPVPRLLKAQLLITQERENEADWLLSHAKDLMEAQGGVSDEVWAYYLYLTSLLGREADQIDHVTKEVERLYRQNPDSWRIAWLLLYLSEEFFNHPDKKLRFLEKQFDRGSNSVVLYLEALQIFQSNPAYLIRLGQFEQQVLYYGARQDCFQQELTERFLEVLEKKKEYSPILCNLLEILYEKRQDSRIVSCMCAMLLKGGVMGPKALTWYEKGVEQQLRLTNLYEAYMSSIDPNTQKGLPKAAVLYFVYNNKLDYERCAFLYDHVLDNKVLYAEVYERYVLKARDFVLEQIGKERINRHLANLYAKLITPEMITDQNAESFTHLVFSSRIHVKDSRLKKVVIYNHGSVLGQEYPITESETCVPIYGNESAVLFEDAYGNRFARNENAELEKYMLPGRYVSELLKHEMNCPEFDLYLIRERGGGEEMDDGFVSRAMRICQYEYVDGELKKHLSLMLMKLFYEKDREEELDQVMDMLLAMELSLEERKEVVRYLVLRGKYEKAFYWVKELGPYFLDANTLSRLITNLIVGDSGEDAAITSAGMYLFRRGKAGALVLAYLNHWATGSCKDLRDLWKELKANGVDSVLLEERLLVQLTFTGAYVGEKAEIFEDYLQKAGMTDVVRAYVLQNAYEYFVRERVTDEAVIRTILEDYQQGYEIPKVCKLAFLKYYAENAALQTREVDAALEDFLREMMAEKIHFGFYRNLKAQRHLLGELTDKVIVEYRTRPGGHARIHYVISQENGEEQEYLAENMRDMFGGICCKEFVLFFGENLQYYVTEEVDGEETLTESGNLQSSELESDGIYGKYGLVNDLVISKSLRDYDTLDKDLETYYFREYCGETLFQIK